MIENTGKQNLIDEIILCRCRLDQEAYLRQRCGIGTFLSQHYRVEKRRNLAVYSIIDK